MPHRSMRPHLPLPPNRLRVMHVASGGFSGATQVALDLTVGGQAHHETLLVLRQKRRTPMARVQALREQGVPLELVTGWNHLSTIRTLNALCQRWKPDVMVGHGFPEHLLARWAAKGASVPVLVQVEHNMRERYSAFKRWQVRQLAPHTAAFVGVSEAVSGVLRDMGLPAQRVRTLRNGIALHPFAQSETQAWLQREPALFMAARFGAQKDHDTLIRSLVPLARDHGLRPALRLAGGGSARHLQAAMALVHKLGLQQQVHFLGHRPDVPQLLMRHQVAVLSTHYEGMPLSLAEAMAAGCAVVGSDVAAVRETLGDGRWGWLAHAGDPQAWADTLATLWRDPSAAAEKAAQARAHARLALSRERMVGEYTALFDELGGRGSASATSPKPMGRPWLSVLIPAHNPGPYLDEALQSVLAQVDTHAEVLVFNDGSTDQTAECLARWATAQETAHTQGRGPRLQVWHQAHSGGVSAARNALLAAARGQWLWFLDADDRLRPGAVAQLRRLVQQQPELQAVVVDHAVWRDAPLETPPARRRPPAQPAPTQRCGAYTKRLAARLDAGWPMARLGQGDPRRCVARSPALSSPTGVRRPKRSAAPDGRHQARLVPRRAPDRLPQQPGQYPGFDEPGQAARLGPGLGRPVHRAWLRCSLGRLHRAASPAAVPCGAAAAGAAALVA